MYPFIFEKSFQIFMINIDGILSEKLIDNILPPNGVMETMRWEHGFNPLKLWHLHYERLAKACQALDYEADFIDRCFLWHQIDQTTRTCDYIQHCRVRLIIFKNETGLHFSIDVSAFEPFVQPLKLGIATTVRKPFSHQNFFKSTNRILFNQAKAEALSKGWDDAIILNEDGFVVETTIANIFWEFDLRLCTTPLSSGCVDGVYRKNFFEKHHSANEMQITPDVLFEAADVFIGNALRGRMDIVLVNA